MFRNMKISLKILLVILIMSLGSLIVVFSASYYFMNSMVDEFQQTNITLGINSSEVTKASLMSQTEYYLLQLIQKQANNANNELHEVNRAVTEASKYTQHLFETRENLIGHDMPRPDETEMGVASSKYSRTSPTRTLSASTCPPASRMFSSSTTTCIFRKTISSLMRRK